MSNLNLTTALIVFASMLVTDVLNAFYIRRVSKGHALQGATLSVFITLVAAVVTISYVDNPIYLIPTALGAFVGTLISVKFDERTKKK